MRSIEFGTPGEMRGRLNALVMAGAKRATTGLLDEYRTEAEGLEYTGERLAVLDDDRLPVATIEVTAAELTTFGAVTWEHAAAEGEGDESLDEWREGHLRYWAEEGVAVDDGTPVVCIAFRLVD
ncbi:ASCH domain-containing protein [Actinokineospora soli]